MYYHIDISNNKDGDVVWQASFSGKGSEDDNADTDQVIGVVKELASALGDLRIRDDTPGGKTVSEILAAEAE